MTNDWGESPPDEHKKSPLEKMKSALAVYALNAPGITNLAKDTTVPVYL